MLQQNHQIQFILYVANQKKSRDFYEKILGYKPSLDVPGMTEFQLNESCKLGLMPENGIAKILSGKTKHPALGNGIPRCELYLMVDSPSEVHSHAILSGAVNISDVALRDWGHEAGYVKDPDGHIIAFAKKV
jgi:catechol 2,3-dioxygenase-like lactoylglutathione lyase family enzyme